MKPRTLRALCSGGLEFAPAQTLGGVRLVAMIRKEPSSDLRLGLRSLGQGPSIVDLGGRPGAAHDLYMSYIPHGMIVSWSDRGEAAVMPETRLDKRGRARPDRFTVGIEHRMVKRGKGNHLRMLPGHVAFEGFLALHFGGPDVKHEEYSLEALGRGLGYRPECAFDGQAVLGLEDALRVFEMHEGQCGVMVYVADALASVTVVGHPDDYAALHRAIVTDSFGELIWRWGCQYRRVQELGSSAPMESAESLDDLRAHVRSMREERAALYGHMAGGLFDRPIEGEDVYSLGPFTLERFMTDLDLAAENHIGECIRREDGTLEYLKTYRLTAAQTQRAHLLRTLYRAGWDLDRAAGALATDKKSLIARMGKAGFGRLFQPHVLEQALRDI